MVQKGLTHSVIASIWMVASCGPPTESAPVGEDFSYLGQEPPGLVPKLFAPGIVSTDNLEIDGAFTPDMREFYFSRQMEGEQIAKYVVSFEDGKWQSPRRIDGYVSFITPDGTKTYFENSYRDRTSTGWSEEKSLGPMFADYPIMRLTVSEAGTYVFDVRDEIGTLRYSRLADGTRQEPDEFPAHINSGRWTAHPFIAPDESYLIWDSEREGGYGETDLYISFREEDGSWGPAINMGPEINTEFEDGGGAVTPDGKFFMYGTTDLSDEGFNQSSANIYWVDAQVIENLRPD